MSKIISSSSLLETWIKPTVLSILILTCVLAVVSIAFAHFKHQENFVSPFADQIFVDD